MPAAIFKKKATAERNALKIKQRYGDDYDFPDLVGDLMMTGQVRVECKKHEGVVLRSSNAILRNPETLCEFCKNERSAANKRKPVKPYGLDPLCWAAPS